MTQKVLWLALLVSISFITFSASSVDSMQKAAVDSVPNMESSATSEDSDMKVLQERGEHLRAELDAVYKRIKADSNLRLNDPNGVDISETLVKYVPIGTSIDDAKVVLQSAGFEVSQRPSFDSQQTQQNREEVRAFIKPYEHGLLYSYYSNVSVTLLQYGSETGRKVGKISAKIFFPAS